MQSNVVEHEPHSALFVPDSDPLVFYRKIEQLSEKYMRGNGRIFLEINQRSGSETAGIFEKKKWAKVVLHKDLSGNDRFIEVWK